MANSEKSFVGEDLGEGCYAKIFWNWYHSGVNDLPVFMRAVQVDQKSPGLNAWGFFIYASFCKNYTLSSKSASKILYPNHLLTI